MRKAHTTKGKSHLKLMLFLQQNLQTILYFKYFYWFYIHIGKGNYLLQVPHHSLPNLYQGQIFTNSSHLRQHASGIRFKKSPLPFEILKTHWGDKKYKHGKLPIMFGN
jgi:hypothetical protein